MAEDLATPGGAGTIDGPAGAAAGPAAGPDAPANGPATERGTEPGTEPGVLPEDAADRAPEADVAADVAVARYVGCEIDGTAYAVPIDAVREVLVPAAWTRLPGAPRGVLGVMGARGRVVGVVDPRPALGLAALATTASPASGDPGAPRGLDGPVGRGPADPTLGRLLVAELPGGPVGLLVDRVTGTTPEPVGAGGTPLRPLEPATVVEALLAGTTIEATVPADGDGDPVQPGRDGGSGEDGDAGRPGDEGSPA